MTSERGASILVVDPDSKVGRTIVAFFAEKSHTVEYVNTSEKAYNSIEDRSFDVLISELNLPRRVEGLRLMAVARERNPEICVVFLADYPDIELATEAMRQGAYDFQTKPPNLPKIEAVVQRGLEHQRLVREQHALRKRLDEHYGLANLIGNSRPMMAVYDAVRKAATSNAPVLLTGESGVGKDLIAQSIHNNGARRDAPFVKYRCGAGDSGRETPPAPARETEAALFGLGSGAPRGAGQRRAGAVELADGGTLFLDRIEGLPQQQQRRIARLIAEGRYQRSGETRTLSADVRLVAASATDDPFPRIGKELLGALQPNLIEIPPLRRRPEDIPLLAQHFLGNASRANSTPAPALGPQALDLLMRYPWPDNVRELRNVLEGISLAARTGETIGPADLPAFVRRAIPAAAHEIRIPAGSSMDMVERIVIDETLRANGYNKEATAKVLGIGLRTLYRKLATFR